MAIEHFNLDLALRQVILPLFLLSMAIICLLFQMIRSLNILYKSLLIWRLRTTHYLMIFVLLKRLFIILVVNLFWCLMKLARVLAGLPVCLSLLSIDMVIPSLTTTKSV